MEHIMKHRSVYKIKKNFFPVKNVTANSGYKCSEMNLAEVLLQINHIYFSKIALLGFQYEQVSLYVIKVSLVWDRISLISAKNQGKVRALLNVANVGNAE